MHLIATSLALLAIAAGMFLLAKTKKEELGRFFKVVSWAIIITGFLSIACVITRAFYGKGCHKKGCGKEYCMKSGKKMRCGMMMQCHSGMKGGCGMKMGGGCCMASGMGCCSEMKNEEGCMHGHEKEIRIEKEIIDGKEHDMENCDEVGCKLHRHDEPAKEENKDPDPPAKK